MPTIQRSALVEHSAARMFGLVNDIAAYPRRFDWCEAAQVIEQDDKRVVARLDLGAGLAAHVVHHAKTRWRRRTTSTCT